MSDRAHSLAQRRTALRAHCALQRAELRDIANSVESRLGSVDRGISLVRRYAARPALIVGGLALLFFVGPRRMMFWASRSAVLFTAGRRLFRLFR